MKILEQINPRIKKILAQAVFSGMKNGLYEISTNKIYSVGVGIDIKKRVINATVGYALNKAILAANDSRITIKNVIHSTGHVSRITYGRFIIYPKRVDDMNQEWDDEAYYHKKLIVHNPTKQGDLFDIYDSDNPVFVQLLFGEKEIEYFAVLRIPDSSGGIYDEEELRLPSATSLVPEEKVRKPKKLSIRHEKASGQ
jgi:hypothetical protein